MTDTVQIAYGLKDNQLVHVSEVASGLACACICPECHSPLIARHCKPPRADHFAHAKDSNCSGAAETILHKLSKELIAELETLKIPPYHYKRRKVLKTSEKIIQHEEPKPLATGGIVDIDQVLIEQDCGNYRPDIIIISKQKQLIVEIAVTHRVERKKLRDIRKDNIAAIEIRLKPKDAMLDREELKDKLQNTLDNKHWLYHPRKPQADMKFYEIYRSTEKRFVWELSETDPEVMNRIVNGFLGKV